MLVDMEVCCSDRPIASATDMKRLAKRVSRMGSGPFLVMCLETSMVICNAGRLYDEVKSRRSSKS